MIKNKKFQIILFSILLFLTLASTITLFIIDNNNKITINPRNITIEIDNDYYSLANVKYDISMDIKNTTNQHFNQFSINLKFYYLPTNQLLHSQNISLNNTKDTSSYSNLFFVNTQNFNLTPKDINLNTTRLDVEIKPIQIQGFSDFLLISIAITPLIFLFGGALLYTIFSKNNINKNIKTVNI